MKITLRECIIVAIAVLLSCLFFSINSWYLRNRMIKIATVDMKSILQAKQKQASAILTKEGLTTEERNATLQSAAGYSEKVNTALNELMESCHCILVSKDLVVVGPEVEDHTSGLLERLKGEL